MPGRLKLGSLSSPEEPLDAKAWRQILLVPVGMRKGVFDLRRAHRRPSGNVNDRGEHIRETGCSFIADRSSGKGREDGGAAGREVLQYGMGLRVEPFLNVLLFALGQRCRFPLQMVHERGGMVVTLLVCG